MNNLKSELRSICCGSRTIEYLLTRKNVKNINLRVTLDGKVMVSANNKVPISYLDNFIQKNSSVILKALDKFAERNKNKVLPRQYKSGEYFTILGKNLQLKVIEGTIESVKSDDSFLYLVVKDNENFARKEKLFYNWERNLQVEIFHDICHKIHKNFDKYNILYPEIKIRKMKARWGSCQPQKGIITLNSKLIEAPIRCIEYVVLHEFSHFIHPNHSKDFYDFVTVLMPDWKERREELNKV